MTPALPLTAGRDAGVTLLEMLIVLVMIGVLTGIATLSFRDGTRMRDTAQEAALLAARLDLAAEQSLIFGRYSALDWSQDSYRFTEWDGTDWRPHASARLAASHSLEPGLRLRGEAGAQSGSLRIRPDLGPPSGGVATLRIAAAGSGVAVRFDGASAIVELGQ
jgi:general secretion pathway protein H